MSVTEREIRVFIPSTFRDMHAERDIMVTVVFLELREGAEQLGLEFFDVDRRCGIPAKDLNARPPTPGSTAGNEAIGSNRSSSASSANATAGGPTRATPATQPFSKCS